MHAGSSWAIAAGAAVHPLPRRHREVGHCLNATPCGASTPVASSRRMPATCGRHFRAVSRALRPHAWEVVKTRADRALAVAEAAGYLDDWLGNDVTVAAPTLRDMFPGDRDLRESAVAGLRRQRRLLSAAVGRRIACRAAVGVPTAPPCRVAARLRAAVCALPPQERHAFRWVPDRQQDRCDGRRRLVARRPRPGNRCLRAHLALTRILESPPAWCAASTCAPCTGALLACRVACGACARLALACWPRADSRSAPSLAGATPLAAPPAWSGCGQRPLRPVCRLARRGRSGPSRRLTLPRSRRTRGSSLLPPPPPRRPWAMRTSGLSVSSSLGTGPGRALRVSFVVPRSCARALLAVCVRAPRMCAAPSRRPAFCLRRACAVKRPPCLRVGSGEQKQKKTNKKNENLKRKDIQQQDNPRL